MSDKAVASSLPGQAPPRAYVKGASCGPGNHAYEAVPGRRYERCPRCGSTRTVRSAAPGVAEPKVRLVKAPRAPEGGLRRAVVDQRWPVLRAWRARTGRDDLQYDQLLADYGVDAGDKRAQRLAAMNGATRLVLPVDDPRLPPWAELCPNTHTIGRQLYDNGYCQDCGGFVTKRRAAPA